MKTSARLMAALVVVFVTSAGADLVQCKKADGTFYVGIAPPEGCVEVDTLRAPRAPKSDRNSSEAKQKEIARRRASTAVTIQNMVIKPAPNGQFFEGTLANGAAFPVYEVRVCIDDGQRCQSVTPSTLFPGAQGTFSFEVARFRTPEWRITWDVVPGEGE